MQYSANESYHTETFTQNYLRFHFCSCPTIFSAMHYNIAHISPKKRYEYKLERARTQINILLISVNYEALFAFFSLFLTLIVCLEEKDGNICIIYDTSSVKRLKM